MGCSSSKEDGGINPDDIYIRDKGGYNSDIGVVDSSKKRAINEMLVQQNAQKVEDVYDIGDGAVLGRGACGSVCVVRKKCDGSMYAMKTVSLDGLGGASMEELRKEIEVQKALDHPNIVRVYEFFEDHPRAQMHIIMELCTGGALVSRMRTHRHGYGEVAAAKLVEKMLSAVMYCHHRGVVHRDIKLDNFIYECEAEDSEIKLIDFGFACEVRPGHESMWEQIGTPSYMAPELWSETAKEYDSSVDMWALGVVTFMLLSGRRPFHHQDRKEKARMIKHDPLRFNGHEWDKLDAKGSAAMDFCEKLMQKDPKKRSSCSKALEHVWIKTNTTKIGADEEIDNNVIDSLQSFARAEDVKKVALEVVAFSTPPQQLEELRELFIKMDQDRSGTISLEEFKTALVGRQSQEEVEKLFRQIDVNSTGSIEYMEFLAATLSSQKAGKDRPSVMAAFAILDRNGDGYITKPELTQSLGDSYSSADLDKMIARAGGSCGCITFDNFKAMMLRDFEDNSGSSGSALFKLDSNARKTLARPSDK